jgi:VIT1/CCC1 family predicted Fe2+/Mn2+ transporter
MNINSVEQSLAKYHLLHFVIGAVLAAVLFLIPKELGVMLTVFLASLFIPTFVLPEFIENKWFDRGAVLVGGLAVAIVFYFLHKL